MYLNFQALSETVSRLKDSYELEREALISSYMYDLEHQKRGSNVIAHKGTAEGYEVQ